MSEAPDTYDEWVDWFSQFEDGALVTPLPGSGRVPSRQAQQWVTPQFWVDPGEDEDDPPQITFVDMDSNRPISFTPEEVEEEAQDRPGSYVVSTTSDARFLISVNLTDEQREAVAERKKGLWG